MSIEEKKERKTNNVMEEKTKPLQIKRLTSRSPSFHPKYNYNTKYKLRRVKWVKIKEGKITL